MSTQNQLSDRLKDLIKTAAEDRRDRKQRGEEEGEDRITFAAFVQDHPGMTSEDHLTAPSIIIDHLDPAPETGGEAVVRIRCVAGRGEEEITTYWAADIAHDIAHALQDVADHTETINKEKEESA